MTKSIYTVLMSGLASGITFAGVSILASMVFFSQPTYACEDDSSQDDTSEEVVVEYSDDIYINEVLPNPSGEESTDEFIELYNASSAAVDLTDWKLSDSTSRDYSLTGSIGAGQYSVFYREASGVALNNSGDTIELYQPDGALLDTIEYTESADGDTSYAVSTDGEWYWTTTITAGRSNTITGITDEENEESEDTEQDEDSQETDDTTEADDSDDNNELQGYDFSNDIEISELLPDPEGSDVTDEWIEIHNTGSSAVDVYGWQVADASKTYTISESTNVAANGYIVLSVIDTGISLNNSGDTIYLYDPASDVMDEVTYEDSESGSAYAKTGSTWNWTTNPTPGEANVITAASADSATADATTTTASPATTVDSDDTTEGETSGTISIAAAKQLSKGDDVLIQGTVNVLPGIFGTQYFYIQDETSGIQIYSSQKEFPELVVGDVVQVTGKLSEANGEIKINTTDISDIVIQNHEDTLTAIEVTDYAEDQLGMLVQTSGEVTEKSGSTIVFDTGWNVYVKRSTGVSTTAFTEGEHVTVVGVLTASDDGIRILPRGEVDITTITEETPNEDAAHASTSFIPAAQASTSDSSNKVFGTISEKKSLPNYWWIIVLAGICVSPVLVSRSQKLSSLLHSRFSQLVRALGTRYGLLVGLEKNATDSTIPTPRHETQTSSKKRS